MNERPSWLDWNGVVELAETLATNKGMLRVDIYVGRPAQETGWFESGGGIIHRLLYPNVRFIQLLFFLRDPTILEEAARSWVAGYKIGNYRLVPSNQVPKEFLETGMLSEDCVMHRSLLSTKD
jgi:hypothetical protein